VSAAGVWSPKASWTPPPSPNSWERANGGKARQRGSLPSSRSAVEVRSVRLGPSSAIFRLPGYEATSRLPSANRRRRVVCPCSRLDSPGRRSRRARAAPAPWDAGLARVARISWQAVRSSKTAAGSSRLTPGVRPGWSRKSRTELSRQRPRSRAVPGTRRVQAAMGERGFEPLKAEPTGLQPVPFGHSGTPPRARAL
jgi:hypothetical protein